MLRLKMCEFSIVLNKQLFYVDALFNSFHLNGFKSYWNHIVLRGLLYETDRDARWKFWIKLLKETNLGVTQAFCDT